MLTPASYNAYVPAHLLTERAISHLYVWQSDEGEMALWFYFTTYAYV